MTHTTAAPVRVKQLGLCEYSPVWRDMQAFTLGRGRDTQDEIWLLEHRPVFTLGMNAKAEHVLAPGDIPVVAVDRGGQVTYHGPGQLVAYLMLDLRRLDIGVRRLVEILDRLLESHGVKVAFGHEVDEPALRDCAVVAASYGGDLAPAGALGVIGPSRMNYNRVIPLVEFLSQLMTERLRT